MTTRSNGGGAERVSARFAARALAADNIDARADEVRALFPCVNAEQVQQLVLPLADERLRDDEQYALRAFRTALCDHRPGFDRLAEPNLVGQDATALPKTSQRKNDGIDLMRIRIDLRLAL